MPTFFRDNSVVSKKENAFTQLSRREYITRLAEKPTGRSNSGQLLFEHQDIEPYKLHVSLSKEAYLKYKNKLISRLKKALSEGDIDTCKFTDENYVANKVEINTQDIETINAQKSVSFPPTQPKHASSTRGYNDPEWATYYEARSKHENLISTWQQAHKETWRKNKYGWPVPVEVKQEREITESLRKNERLLNGDQVTIYISKSHDKNKIISLLHDIEAILADAEPGKCASCESQLSQHISFRQDHVFQRYDLNTKIISYPDITTMSAVEKRDYYSYVDAISDEDVEKRAVVKPLQEQSELFTFLRQHLDIVPIINVAKKNIWELSQISVPQGELKNAITGLCRKLENALNAVTSNEEQRTTNSMKQLFNEVQTDIQEDLNIIRENCTNKVMLNNVIVSILSVIGVFSVIGTIPVLMAWKNNMERYDDPFVFFDAIKIRILSEKFISDKPAINMQELKQAIQENREVQNTATPFLNNDEPSNAP